MAVLHARVGDLYIVLPHRLGASCREGVVVGVLGEDGRPPYVVRWCDRDETETVDPGPDALVLHYERAAR